MAYLALAADFPARVSELVVPYWNTIRTLPRGRFEEQSRCSWNHGPVWIMNM